MPTDQPPAGPAPDAPPNPPESSATPVPRPPRPDFEPGQPAHDYIIEEALSLFTHGPGRNPLLDKMTAKQVTRTLEIQARREENQHELRVASQKAAASLSNKLIVFAAFAVTCLLVLFWLFLYYGKTDQVFNLIAILATGGGGVGIGVGLKRGNNSNSSAQSDSLQE